MLTTDTEILQHIYFVHLDMKTVTPRWMVNWLREYARLCRTAAIYCTNDNRREDAITWTSRAETADMSLPEWIDKDKL